MATSLAIIKESFCLLVAFKVRLFTNALIILRGLLLPPYKCSYYFERPFVVTHMVDAKRLASVPDFTY